MELRVPVFLAVVFSLIVPHGPLVQGQPNRMTPFILAVEPNTAQAGAAGVVLTVHGANFAEDSVVKWNDVDRKTTFVASNTLKADIPAGELASAGSAKVNVYSPSLPTQVSNAVFFTIGAGRR